MSENLLKASDCLIGLVNSGHYPGEAGGAFDDDLAALVQLATAHDAPLVTLQSSSTRKAAIAPISDGPHAQTIVTADASLGEAAANASTDRGRSKLVLAGRPTEGPLSFTALGALTHGLDVVVVEDCCQSGSAHVHRIAIQRLAQSGAVITTVAQLQLEWMATREISQNQLFGATMQHSNR